MSKASERATERLDRAVQRLTQLKARQLMIEQQEKLQLKEQELRALVRRRYDFGEAVIAAGLSDWNPFEVVGALLEVRDRIGLSKTQRMAAQKRGEQHLGRPHVPAPDKPPSPDTTDHS